MTQFAIRLFMLLFAGLTLAVAGCDDSASVPTDGSGKDVAPIDAPSRAIVSLSPALTNMIVDMGMSSSLVGVGDNDDAVPEAMNLRSVGPYPNVDSETLISLKPTHVLVMAGTDGVPDALTTLATTHDFKIISFNYPSSVRDVSSILMGEFSKETNTIVTEKSLGGALGSHDLAFMLATEVNARLAKIVDVTDAIPYDKRPRVLVVFGTTPRFMAAGPKTVLHDLMTQYCRAENAAIPKLKAPTDIYNAAQVKQAMVDPASLVGTAPTFDRERLLEANPDVILLLLPGEPELQSVDEDPRLISLRGLDIEAVKNNRVVLISHPLALLPSSSLHITALAMAKAIHPQLADQLETAVNPPRSEKKDDDQGGETPAQNKVDDTSKSGPKLIAPNTIDGKALDSPAGEAATNANTPAPSSAAVPSD